MFETPEGASIPSVLMIDQEEEHLYYLHKLFTDRFPEVKFFSLTDPSLAVKKSEMYGADLIITEIYFPRYQFDSGEALIEGLRQARPEAKIMVLSVHQDEHIIYKYRTVFGVDAYLKKISCRAEDIVNKSFELLGRPHPFPS